MSLIGPRPLLPDDQASILRLADSHIGNVRPGVTGLAQVNGRNFVSPRNKVRYDGFYARELCLMLDIKILAKTLKVVRRPDYVM